MEPERESLRIKVEQAARDLESLGYAVLPGLFTSDECDQKLSEMWDCLERASQGVLKRDADFASMKASAMPAHKHGISESWRLNHAPPVRAMRRDERVIEVFARLFGTKRLTCSMDRVNFKFPGRKYKSQGDWPHMDQNPRQLGRITIQTYITLTDAPLDAPGNRLYEASHLVFAERWAYMRKSENRDNWQTLTSEEASELGKVCPLVKPVLRKGDMLLWDSRVAHSPSDGVDFTNGRFVVYICMSPLWEKANDTKFWAKKKAAFEECRATNHRPVPQKLFGKTPRAYGGVQPAFAEFDKTALGITDEPIGAERLLFGFDKYDAQHELLPGVAIGQPLLSFVSPFTPLLPGVDEPVTKKQKKQNNK